MPDSTWAGASVASTTTISNPILNRLVLLAILDRQLDLQKRDVLVMKLGGLGSMKEHYILAKRKHPTAPEPHLSLGKFALPIPSAAVAIVAPALAKFGRVTTTQTNPNMTAATIARKMLLRVKSFISNMLMGYPLQ